MIMYRPSKPDKDTLTKLAVIAFLLISTFIFLLKSPMHIWIGADSGTDQSVFQTVAMMMRQGYMPYRDSFDHKGPLIYLINLCGMAIGRQHGIWLIEAITIFMTFAAIHKIAGLCCDTVFSCICVLISGALLFDYFKQGNMTEEYAMPFLAISLYIYLDYFRNRKITKFRLILCGLGFGAVCLLRPNMISVWVVFSIAVLIDCIRKHRPSILGKFLLFFLLGFSIIVVPILLWLAINHSLQAFVEDYIQFNMLYSSAKGGVSLSAQWACFAAFLKPTVYFSQVLTLLALIICTYLCLTEDYFLYGTYIIYIIITLLFICVSGRAYNHYGMILVPAIAFPIASLYELCFSKGGGRMTAFIMLYLFLLGGIALPDWLSTAKSMTGVYSERNEEHHSELVRTVCGIVEENTSPEDCISVYGNWNIIYVQSGRLHATRYSYQFPIGNVSPDILNEYFDELAQELPPIIVIQADRSDSHIESFLAAHPYTEIWSQESAGDSPARIFKLSGIMDER